jgi:hypothetical protein
MQSHTGSTYTVGLCRFGRGIPAAGYHARKGATAYSRFGHMEEAFRQLDIMLEKGLQLTVGLDPWKRHFSSWISC